MDIMNTNNGTNAKIVPVTFKDALLSLKKGTTAKELFTFAYDWGSLSAIPADALRIVWPDSSIVDDKVTKYLDTVYHVQYCALKYWEDASNPKQAEEWRTKVMDAWGAILEMAGCQNKRDNTDFLFIIARAATVGKAEKGAAHKVIKATTKATFRKFLEFLLHDFNIIFKVFKFLFCF